MSILAKHVVLVKEHVAIQDRLAQRYVKDERRSGMHIKSRDDFRSLLQALEESDAALDAAQLKEATHNLSAPVLTLTSEELEGLPPELLAELSEGAVPDKTETTILNTINERGGIATLDQIMVGMFRTLNEVSKRTTLTSRLYRMIQKGTIFPVPVRKGVYSTRRITEENVKDLFGNDDDAQSATLI